MSQMQALCNRLHASAAGASYQNQCECLNLICLLREPVQAPSLCKRGLEKFLEDASELGVEYGVNGRIEKAVDVSEPDEEGEKNGIQMTGGIVLIQQIIANTDGVDYVDREEWNPTEQEYTCQKIRIGYSKYFKSYLHSNIPKYGSIISLEMKTSL